MKLLILGGTLFVGRHLAEQALARNHDVTLFNRGQFNAHLFPDIEKLRGDRNGNLESLRGHTWDAVIDVSGYVPRHVHDTATLLADAVEHYTFISSISAYAVPLAFNTDESAPVATLPPQFKGTEEVNGTTYGPFKVLCEQAAECALPGRVLSIRAGLTVGPYDPWDRVTFLTARFADPERNIVVVPAEFNQPVQLIDARDLAGWVLDMIAQRKTGTYNAMGPTTPLTFGEIVETCHAVSGKQNTIRKVPGAQLVAGGVRPATDIPFWLTQREITQAQVSNHKAVAEGLMFRPLPEIVEDSFTWRKLRNFPYKRSWSYEREQAFL